MVLLQPDLDISSDDDDWVLLDSVLRNNNNDYDKIFEQYKVTETRIQTIPVHECKRRFSLDFSWLWIFPVLALMFATIHLVQRYDLNNMNEQFSEKFLTDSVGKTLNNQSDHFIVANDTYFYPSTVIPPPKYNEAIEAMLLSDEEECNVTNEMKLSDQKWILWTAVKMMRFDDNDKNVNDDDDGAIYGMIFWKSLLRLVNFNFFVISQCILF